MKFFEVFRAGVYPQGTYTKKEIKQIADNYNPEFCEAPVTIDHQQVGPAYGWVENVKADGEKLKVSFKDMPEEMKNDVNARRFKKVSVEIYKNLEGKGCYLKAVSFLGAAAPQVKGLEPIKFMESESDCYEFEMDSSETETFTEEDVNKLKAQINDLEKQIATFKEGNKRTETIRSLKEKITELTNEVSKFKEEAQGKEEIEQELNSIKIKIKNKEFDDLFDKQIEKGTLIPTNKNVVLSVLQELDNIEKFCEEPSVITDFKAFIESLPKQVEFKEIATKDKQAKGSIDVEPFADADEESLEVFKEAKAMAAKENISFKEALLKLNI